MSIVKTLALALVVAAGLSTGSLRAAEEPKPKDPKDMKADEAEDAGRCPVCKKEFKPVYHYEYKGRTYHFDTRVCQKDFTADPTKYGALGSDYKPPKKDDPPPPDPKKKDDKKPK